MRRVVVVLLIVLAFAGLMLLLTAAIQPIGDVAEGMNLRFLGRFGIVVAGLLAPLAYALQRVQKALFGLGSTEKEKQVAERNEELEKRIARIEADVKRLDDERRRELGAALDRVARVEKEIEADKQTLAAADRALAAKMDEILHPRHTGMSWEELSEKLRVENVWEISAPPSDGGGR